MSYFKDKRQCKKYCKYGTNCFRKQTCKYYHQGQPIDDASMSKKKDQMHQHKYQKSIKNDLYVNHHKIVDYDQYQAQKDEKHNYYHKNFNFHHKKETHHQNHHKHHNHHNHHNHHYHHNHHRNQLQYKSFSKECSNKLQNHSDKQPLRDNACKYERHIQLRQRNFLPKHQMKMNNQYKSYKQKVSQKQENIHEYQKSSQFQDKNSSLSEDSRQASISEDQKRNLQKQKDLKVYRQKILQNKCIYQQYYEACLNFFETRGIPEAKRIKIIQFLIVYAPLSIVQDVIISSVIQLQKQGFIDYFNFKKLIKMFCKKNYDIQQTRKTLLKKIDIQSKRRHKDKDYQQKFPTPKPVNFLQSQDLLNNQIQNSNTIYLIDGNNCLTTQKHLRSFFQSEQNQKKVQAQCRLKWLLSTVLGSQKVYLFFDNQYQVKNYQMFKKKVLHQIQYQQYEKIHIIFPNLNEKADDSIINCLKKLKQQNNNSKIILITGDRVLTQESLNILQLQKSSGLYFIKFLKKLMKKKLQNLKVKKLLKRIFNYGD